MPTVNSTSSINPLSIVVDANVSIVPIFSQQQATPTPSPSKTPPVTPSRTTTPLPTQTPGASPTPQATQTPAASPAASPATSPAATPPISATPQASQTPAASPTPEASQTPEVTVTPSISLTPSVTRTPPISNTPVPSVTPTISDTPSPSQTPGASRTPDASVTPSQTPGPSVTPTVSQVFWRSCIDGNLRPGTPDADYVRRVYPLGGVCWEPSGQVGFEPSLSEALRYEWRRGSLALPEARSVKVVNPSFAATYAIGMASDKDILITPNQFTIGPRESKTVVINVTQPLLDRLADGATNLALQVEVREI